MGGLFNQINANLFHAMGNNPITYTDPDGRAAFLSRVISAKTGEWYYNAANWLGRNVGICKHWLVDMHDLNYVERVYQYSGKTSGITFMDKNSSIRCYKVEYSNMDDRLTNQAAKNVIDTGKFDTEDYNPIFHNCKSYTKAVFKEYKKLWKEDFKKNNPNASKSAINKAWKQHYKDITKDRGRVIDFTPQDKTDDVK